MRGPVPTDHGLTPPARCAEPAPPGAGDRTAEPVWPTVGAGLHLLSLTHAGTVAHASLAGMTDPRLDAIRAELADIPAIEVISRAAVMLMSAAAEKLGLSSDDPAEQPAPRPRRGPAADHGVGRPGVGVGGIPGPARGPVARRADEPATGVPRVQRRARRTRAPDRAKNTPAQSVTQPIQRLDAHILAADDRHDHPADFPVVLGPRDRRDGWSAPSPRCRCWRACRRCYAWLSRSRASSSTTTSSTSPTPASRGRSCWPCSPRRLPRANASRGGSWCSTWCSRRAGTSATSRPVTRTRFEMSGEMLGPGAARGRDRHAAARLPRVLRPGAPWRAAAGRRRAGGRDGGRHPAGLGTARGLPRHAAAR